MVDKILSGWIQILFWIIEYTIIRTPNKVAMILFEIGLELQKIIHENKNMKHNRFVEFEFEI